MAEKVAILGGGLGALAAALELTEPGLGARFDVTLYTQGHRLGGKCASSRNPLMSHRNEEHGLHVWFGFYENAFALLDRVYQQDPKRPYPTVWEAFFPRDYTVLGSGPKGGADRWDVIFPPASGRPGDGRPLAAPTEILPFVAGTFYRVVTALFDEAIVISGSLTVDAALLALKLEFVALAGFFHAIGVDRLGDAIARFGEASGGLALLDRVGDVLGRLFDLVEPLIPGNQSDLVHLSHAADLFLAGLRGLLDPDDAVLDHDDFDVLDKYEFRQWLRDHGARPATLDSTFVRAVYECFFVFDLGKRDRPKYGAGTALRCVLRVGCTYKGHVLYLPRMGFGEAIIAPLYRVLKNRGVKFKFFHRVTGVFPDAAGTRIGRVELSRQVDLNVPEYSPLIAVGPVEAWPVQPLWGQIVSGPALAATLPAPPDLESFWCPHTVGPSAIDLGVDFDHVVLAIPVTAMKGLAAPIVAVRPSWQHMIDALPPVPNIALQLWMDKRTTQLGPWASPPALDAGPAPFSVWTDMSPTLDTESWPAGDEPASVHYLCGVLDTDLCFRDASESTTQTEANQLARRLAIRFMETDGYRYWPDAYAPGRVFRWDTLHAPATSVLQDRIDDQYIRCNVDPSEVTHNAPPGSTALRLYAGDSGFDNLVCAGDWVRTGLNSAAVEGAIMGGRQAARALLGATWEVPGEFWMSRRPARLSGVGGPPSGLPAYVDGIGHGEQCIPFPGVMTDASLVAFAVDAAVPRLQATVDRYLNDPTGRPTRYVADVPYVLVTFMDAKMQSASTAVGWLPDRECALWIPLRHGARRLWWMPYIVVDTSIAMVTGRETWGFTKQLGRIEFAPPRFTAFGTVFDPLTPATMGVEAPLVTARRVGPVGTVAAAVSGITAFAGLAAGRVFDELFGVPQPTVVNLKQFRDAKEPGKACYQSIVESRFNIDDLKSGQLLGGSYRISFANVSSHTIASDLGVAPVSTAKFAARLQVDFTAFAGEEVWKFR